MLQRVLRVLQRVLQRVLRVLRGRGTARGAPSLSLTPAPALQRPATAAPPALPAGLAWTAVQENPRVRELLDVLSLSVDRGGQVYVSTFEARDYPIYGTQW